MTSNTLLHRQVHPLFIQDGRISSQVFRPTPKDESLLSVYDGDLITAEKAWAHYVQNPRCQSAGVMAVSVGECEAESLTACADPRPFPEHAVIDFSRLSRNEVERKAKQLKLAAEVRGWQYRPEVVR